MIVVDTSVWVDHLRNRVTEETEVLVELLESNEAMALTTAVRMELLRGVHPDDHVVLGDVLDEFELISTIDSDFDLAADLFRAARATGSTVRSSIDCLIAAPCIRLGLPLLHADGDFDRLAAVSVLRVVAT